MHFSWSREKKTNQGKCLRVKQNAHELYRLSNELKRERVSDKEKNQTKNRIYSINILPAFSDKS